MPSGELSAEPTKFTDAVCTDSSRVPNVLQARLLVDCQCTLGEGVQWNAVEARLYWTDIFGDVLYSCDATGDRLKALPLDDGLCAFAFTDTHDILAAFVDGLYRLDWRTGERNLIRTYQEDLPRTRMNDGALDRQGRFVVGGMDENGMTPITDVWSVRPCGIDTVIDGVGCANSIAFSSDGKTMYFADSASRDIARYDYDPATGRPSNARLFARMDKVFGVPDGSCVDADGGLWNARFGGGCVQRFRADGSPDMRVTLPVPNVTCCCIGGRQMNRMFITTARAGMPDKALSATPSAGGVFVVDLPVRGLDQGTYKWGNQLK